MAYERVTLYGVPLVADRLVSYGQVDPRARAASCSSGTRWSTASGTPGTGSSTTNRELLEEAEELEHRARRRDIVVDEHTLFDFYDARVGAERRQRRPLRPVVEAASAGTRPDLLTFDPAMLTHDTADEVTRGRLPRAAGSRAARG